MITYTSYKSSLLIDNGRSLVFSAATTCRGLMVHLLEDQLFLAISSSPIRIGRQACQGISLCAVFNMSDIFSITSIN
jgi:hypothetical protein